MKRFLLIYAGINLVLLAWLATQAEYVHHATFQGVMIASPTGLNLQAGRQFNTYYVGVYLSRQDQAPYAVGYNADTGTLFTQQRVP